MGCPVPKVCKTGAGAALLREPERALAVARAAIEGSGLPVTVKLRSGTEPGDRSGYELALRLADEAGVSAIGFHPRSARSTTVATPTTPSPGSSPAELDVPGDRLRRAPRRPSPPGAPTRSPAPTR